MNWNGQTWKKVEKYLIKLVVSLHKIKWELKKWTGIIGYTEKINENLK